MPTLHILTPSLSKEEGNGGIPRQLRGIKQALLRQELLSEEVTG